MTLPILPQLQIMNDKNFMDGRFTTAFMNTFKIEKPL